LSKKRYISIFAFLCVLWLATLACQLTIGNDLETPVPTTTVHSPNPTGTGENPDMPPASSTPSSPIERPVTVIPLNGPIQKDSAELSGLAWFGDTLILAPQYPSRFGSGDGAVFALSRDQVINYLDGASTGPLEPQEIPFISEGFEKSIPNFEGYEAIAFLGDQAFLTIEARGGASMFGFLVRGAIKEDLSELRLDPNSLTENYLQANWSNKSDETIVVKESGLFTIYEVNGVELNRAPSATLFDFSFQVQGSVPLPNIEFRLTDATALDAANRFWAINYFFPGDTEQITDHDPIAEQYGKGATHSRFDIVERLLEFQYDSEGITLTDSHPIHLELLEDGTARNWEGIVRLGERGFLLVTDKYPTTILAFVPLP